MRMCIFRYRLQESFVLNPHRKWSESEVPQSCQLFATPWTVAHQAPLSMGFSRQEYWSGLPFPSPGDLPDPGIEPRSPALQADSLTSEPPGKPRLPLESALNLVIQWLPLLYLMHPIDQWEAVPYYIYMFWSLELVKVLETVLHFKRNKAMSWYRA